jgi:uncharacterized repeat protein (TIGR01451 family)
VIDIEKATNGQDADGFPGPYILVGGPVTWTYVVTNTGDLPLSDVTVTDNQGVAVSCPQSILDPGGEMSCTANGTAEAGQYENTGTAVGTPPDLDNVSDTDLSHYFGAAPAIGVEKEVSVDDGTTWVDADEPPGPSAIEGSDVQFKVVVTNIGNVDLSNITLSDTDFGVSSCVVPGSLAVDGSFECVMTVSAVFGQLGQHTNTATASGDFTDANNNTETVSDSDDATLTVYAPTQVTLSASACQYSDETTITATLTSQGSPLVGKQLTITLRFIMNQELQRLQMTLGRLP